MELNKSGIAILLAEQNVEKAIKIADQAYLMSSGHMKFSGDPAQLTETVLSSVFGQ